MAHLRLPIWEDALSLVENGVAVSLMIKHTDLESFHCSGPCLPRSHWATHHLGSSVLGY